MIVFGTWDRHFIENVLELMPVGWLRHHVGKVADKDITYWVGLFFALLNFCSCVDFLSQVAVVELVKVAGSWVVVMVVRTKVRPAWGARSEGAVVLMVLVTVWAG